MNGAQRPPPFRNRLYAALVISVMPTSWLRVRLYRWICGYQVSGRARLGFGTVIGVARATIGAVTIGRFNRFHGPCTLELADGVQIGSHNAFTCGDDAGDYARLCRIGRDARIMSGHYIDVVGGFEFGARSWLAGYGTQVWTHGVGTRDRTVRIGADCYIGSAARFAPGAQLGDCCLVALASVVGKKFGDQVLVGGVPARVIAEHYDWRERIQKPASAPQTSA
jgi:acetyltransferase-like isoleucine patch superfamily enzyme